MIVTELRILEALIVLFLAVPLLRPHFKAMQSLDGLAWLPLVALGLLIGIFPAYGFHPECLPLMVYALVSSIVSLRKNASAGDRRRLASVPLTVFVYILLAAVFLPAFVFFPGASGELAGETESVRMRKISDKGGGKRGTDYFLRIYDAVQTDESSVTTESPVTKPLIFLVPPEKGSAASVDMVCVNLREAGFTVITYSRKGYDTPLIDGNGKKHLPSPAKLFSFQRTFSKAAKFASDNEKGKALENERRHDIEFLLSKLPSLQGERSGVPPNSVPPTLLVGYGAGGSALAYLAGESEFASRYGNVLGVAAVESRLWSAYLPAAEKRAQISASAKIIPRLLAGLFNLFEKIKRRRVERTGPLPDAGLPVLYLVSGRALDFQKGRQPYQAVFDALDSGSGPAALAAVESAGPLDYQDFPLTRPVYSFLQPGPKNAKKSENPVSDTAGVIGNFAVFLLERAEQRGNDSLLENFYGDGAKPVSVFPEAGGEIFTPPLREINGGLYVQSKGLPGFRLHP